MIHDFSLEQFTPIRPKKVDQLFSPVVQWQPDVSRIPSQSTGVKRPVREVPPTTQSNSPSRAEYETSKLANNIIQEYKPIHKIRDELPVRAARFHPNGEVYAIGSNTKALRLFAYPTPEQFKHFSGEFEAQEPELIFTFLKIHRGSIYCVAFNDDGSLIATGSNDQTIHVVRYNHEKQLPEANESQLTMHSGTVRDIQFNSTSLISAGAGDFAIYVTDCNTFKESQLFVGHQSTVMSLDCYGEESQLFASGSLDGSIKLWDIRTKRCTKTIRCNKTVEGESCENGPPVGVVRVDRSGKLLVSGHDDGRCMLYDIRGGGIVQLFQAHEGEVRALNFSPKSYYLVTGGYDGRLKLMDLQGNLTSQLPCVEIGKLGDKVVQTDWHPSDYNFVTTCADGTASLWTIPEMGEENTTI